MIGIYAIRNIINNKIYIGSSNNIKRRWKKHKTELKNKSHSNKYLERAYHKYGSDKFDFIILEFCKEQELINREIFYINYYKSLDLTFGYNLKVPEKHPSITSSTEYSKILSNSKKGITPNNFVDMQKTRWKEIEVFVHGSLIWTFSSLRETERQLNIPRGNVYNYLKGKTNKLKNFEQYHFQYKHV